MLTYALQQGLRQQIIEADYSHEIATAMESLKKHTRIDGTVDFAQGNLIGLARHSSRFEPAPLRPRHGFGGLGDGRSRE